MTRRNAPILHMSLWTVAACVLALTLAAANVALGPWASGKVREFYQGDGK